MPEGEKGPDFAVSIRYRDGIDDVLPEEVRLIEANLPELLKLLMQELPDEEG